MAAGATAVVTNGRVLMLHDPGSGFQDAFQAGDMALLDVHAQASQGADQVLMLPFLIQLGLQQMESWELFSNCMCLLVQKLVRPLSCHEASSAHFHAVRWWTQRT